MATLFFAHFVHCFFFRRDFFQTLIIKTEGKIDVHFWNWTLDKNDFNANLFGCLHCGDNWLILNEHTHFDRNAKFYWPRLLKHTKYCDHSIIIILHGLSVKNHMYVFIHNFLNEFSRSHTCLFNLTRIFMHSWDWTLHCFNWEKSNYSAQYWMEVPLYEEKTKQIKT